MIEGYVKINGSPNAPDEQELRDLQGELVAADSSRWEPRCVARAFCSGEDTFVLTMVGVVNRGNNDSQTEKLYK